ncbi:MAG TPA: YbaB/EbfC family nucleoid-associated protein [Candidatus Kapabacteria bacterium]|nr:YbaB/EbfC family nucleoid-associated protein [Candidatus Kapabacteria bacterium]
MNPDLMGALGKMREMQEQMEKAQAELGAITATAEAGGGMVKVTANGRQEIVSIKFEKEVINPAEQEMLEDLVVAASNRALAKAKELSESTMNAVAKKFMPNIPGLTI